MTATADRRFGDGISVQQQSQKITAQYQVRVDPEVDPDYDDIYAAILTDAAAATPLGFLLGAIDVDEGQRGNIWTGSAVYNTPEIQQKQPKKTGESSFNFTTAGGSQHVLQAVKHISSTKCPGASSDPPDVGGAINVDGEGNIGGCDIVVPICKFKATLHVAADDMDDTYIADLIEGTGRVNDDVVVMVVEGVNMTFQAGELLFEGANLGTRGAGDWELAMDFAVSRNVTDICADWPASSKPTAAVPKKGWEYAWIRYEEKPDSGGKVLIRLPAAVYVEQVYKTFDFDKLNVPAS